MCEERPECVWSVGVFVCLERCCFSTGWFRRSRLCSLMSVQNDGEEDGSNSPTMWGVNYFAPLPTASTANQRKRRWLLGQWASAAKLMRKYKLGEVLGTGADAKVVKATRRFDGTVYAIKVIELKQRSQGQSFDGKKQQKIGGRASRVATQARAARIQRELEIHSKLPRHPHIVPCYEVFSGTKRSHLVLGLCRGGTLLDSVCSGTRSLGEPAAARIARQVLEAIRFLHLHGVVHRDLKLENLLLVAEATEDDFRVQLSDFGSARYFKSITQHHPDHFLEREATAHVGTLAYMAPEQHTGGTADAALDMWSFGIVLAALCTGRHPLREVPKEEWHAEMQRDRLPDGASKAAAAAWATLPDARDLAHAVLRLESSDRITAVQALRHRWILKHNNSQEKGKEAPVEQPKQRNEHNKFGGMFARKRRSSAPEPSSSSAAAAAAVATKSLKSASSIELLLRDGDEMRLSKILSRLRDIQRPRLQRVLSLLVALLAPDASAMTMFEGIKGDGRDYLSRDDVEEILVEDGVSLRAVDELCETFAELSFDGSGNVFEPEFIAGVISLRPRSRLEVLVAQAFERLDGGGGERTRNELVVDYLIAQRLDGRLFIPGDDELHTLLDNVDIPSCALVVDIVAAAAVE